MIQTHATPELTLQTCDQEPIHIPGSIQRHGALLTLDPDSLRVLQASENVEEIFGQTHDRILGDGLEACVGDSIAAEIREDLRRANPSHLPVFLRSIESPLGNPLQVIAHCYDHVAVVEFEKVEKQPAPFLQALHPLVSGFVQRLQRLSTSQEVLQVAAEQVREITELDRVLVYKFDPDWNGIVVAESRNDVLPSYLDLRFPADDIPRQAREMYRTSAIRLIPDADYTPAALSPALNPKTGRPLDMTYSILRSVSPIHRTYMRNMGTQSSMSVSLLRDTELWGLIACHNRDARHVSFEVRKACEFIGQVLSVQIAALERNAEYAERVRLKIVETRLLAHMARQENFADGLLAASESLLEFAEATGAAILQGGECSLVGMTPPVDQVRELVEWLSDQAATQDIYQTSCLSEVFPPATNFVDKASGLLAVRISKLYSSYLLFFRPEQVQTVRWGGDPTKPLTSGPEKLHPRKSFELWKEVVRGRSLPWKRTEIEAAVDLRNAIVGIVLRKAEEMAELTAQLEQSNKELEAFSYSVSHDLRAPFRHIVGYSELLREREAGNLSKEGSRYVNTIIESAQYAGMLVDNLLNFSRIARTSMTMLRVDMNHLVREIRKELTAEQPERQVTWNVSPLPEVIADPVLLKLALRNLLSNALKYTRDREQPTVEVGTTRHDGDLQFWVRDNGVGFDMRYVDKLFGVFQRLHRMEDFEGTGIGLANVRRIIGRHGGKTWAEGTPGKGATFYFSLPASAETEVSRA